MDSVFLYLGLATLILTLIIVKTIVVHNSDGVNISTDAYWVEASDNYGISYYCSKCGHNEFYVDSVPEPCKHNPLDYEIGMHTKRMARKVNIKHY